MNPKKKSGSESPSGRRIRESSPKTAGERADERFRALTIRLNRGTKPRVSDIRPIA